VWKGLLFNLLVCGNGDKTLAGGDKRLPGTAEKRHPRAAGKGHGCIISPVEIAEHGSRQGRCGDGRDYLGLMSRYASTAALSTNSKRSCAQEKLGKNKQG
jgi:hypothetical protein